MKILGNSALCITAVCALLAVAGRAEAQNEPFQHVAPPAELPAGISVVQAQKLGALIDDFRFEEPLVVSKLKDNIYFARGGVGRNVPNQTFVVGRTGVILIDNKNSIDAQKAVFAEIAKITPNPVIADIVLHTEHQSGIAALPAGVTIVANQTAKHRIETSTERDKIPSAYFPTRWVSKDETMTIDGIRVRLLDLGSPVSEGDLFAYLPDQKVVFASTMLVTNFTYASTVIHNDLGGTVGGWIEAAKGLLALDADTYVSDHGAVLTKEEFRTKLAFVQDKWNRVKAMVAEGKSLEQIEAAIPAPGDRKPTTVENIYRELHSK